MKRTPLKRRTPLRAKKRLVARKPAAQKSGSAPRLADLDSLFSLYVRTRDGFRCQRCRIVYVLGDQNLHCSHFIGRGNRAVRFDLDNCDALCVNCHVFLEGRKKTDYRDFKIAQLGQERYDALLTRSRKHVKIDRPAVSAQIKRWIAELEDRMTFPCRLS